VATAEYTIELPAATSVFSQVAGTYMAVQSVSITDAKFGVTIYYTTNGSTPTTYSVHSWPLSVAATETLKVLPL